MVSLILQQKLRMRQKLFEDTETITDAESAQDIQDEDEGEVE